MNAQLNLHTLCDELRRVKEQKPQFDQELNPYLINTILFRLECEDRIELGEIDFEQFDEDDILTVIDYFDWWEHLRYSTRSYNKCLCSFPPSCVKARTFL